MHVESRFYNFAVSPVGAIGLMQVMPETGEELAARLGIHWVGPQTLFDPTVNVRLGVAYLRELSDRYDGNLPTALAAYNWGPGHIDRRLRLGTATARPVPQPRARSLRPGPRAVLAFGSRRGNGPRHPYFARLRLAARALRALARHAMRDPARPRSEASRAELSRTG